MAILRCRKRRDEVKPNRLVIARSKATKQSSSSESSYDMRPARHKIIWALAAHAPDRDAFTVLVLVDDLGLVLADQDVVER